MILDISRTRVAEGRDFKKKNGCQHTSVYYFVSNPAPNIVCIYNFDSV